METIATPPASCVTCGTTLHGRYCHACGERVLTAADQSFAGFVRDAAAGAFDLDSRLWRSFWLLLRRPGLLTAEWARGRRTPYIAPLQLFLIANLVFFVVLSTLGGFSTFTTRLEYHGTQAGYGPIAARMIAERVTPGTPEAVAFAQEFDETTPRYANSMVIVMVPLLALVFKLLARRRPFVHHLTFAFHFMTFLLLFITVLPMVLSGLIALVPGALVLVTDETWISLAMLAMFGLHVRAMWQGAWGGPWWASWLRAGATALLVMPVLTVYRALLFFTVFHRI